MNYRHIKSLIAKFLSGNNASKSVQSISEKLPIVTSIHNVLERINQSDTIDASMKLYSNRLVHIYLKAVIVNYDSCVGEAEDMALRLGRDIDTIYNEIMGHIEVCLIDIEHGAIFKDNLSDVFLSCLMGFEQKIEARTSY